MNIGVVGGGIAGLYCALELGSNHKVSVFEALNRLGGRIETLPLGGFNAECGPMRFELGTQPLIQNLIDSLGLETHTFPPPEAEPVEFPKYDLADHEMSGAQKQSIEQAQLSSSQVHPAMFSHLTTALQLLQFGIYRMLNEDSQLTLTEIVDPDENGKIRIQEYAGSFKEEKDYNQIRTRKYLGRHPIWFLGFWNGLARVLSPPALAKLRDTGTFYHLLPENPSASEWAIFWLRLFKPSPQCDLSTIEDGIETIVTSIEEKLQGMKNVTILKNAIVDGIVSDSTPGKLTLNVEIASADGAQIRPFADFDHVIFALPAKPLQTLMLPFPERIKTYLQAVIPFTLLKVFVVIRDPWWTKPPKVQSGANLLPTREIHYKEFKEGGNRFGMILLYMDRPAISYWRHFITNPHAKAQRDSTTELRREIVRQLAAIWPKQDDGISDLDHRELIDEHIVTFAIRDWSHLPFGAACHAWIPGTEVPVALNCLKAFSLASSPRFENVHVCGEAYSDYQGFIEGSLRSANSVVRTIQQHA